MTHPAGSPSQDRQARPGEHTIQIRYRPSPRGCGACYTRIEATEGLAASIHYANDPIVEALPLASIGGMTHSEASLWLGDAVELCVGPLRMMLCLGETGEQP